MNLLPLSDWRFLQKTKLAPLQPQELVSLRARATKVLEQLVTPEGIYASSAHTWQGPYHAFFGRDSAITATLIMEAEKLSGEDKYTTRAIQALRNLAQFQGMRNRPEFGEELGKLPHEVRKDRKDIQQLQNNRIKNGDKLWHVNPFDNYAKNWDSHDSTPLWIITLCRYYKNHKAAPSPVDLKHLRLALTWCSNQLENAGYFAGFMPAQLQSKRRYGGLQNQGWKDSWSVYLNKEGRLATYPIYDVFINATFWAALRYGSNLMKDIDHHFSAELATKARKLKNHFNSIEHGFRFKTDDCWYYSDALDGKFNQLGTEAIDTGLSLWAYCRKETVINSRFINDVTKRITKPDFLDPAAGLRVYPAGLSAYVAQDVYHRGPNTYWPFVSGLASQALAHLGYKNLARQVATAMLRGVSRFDSCVELFLQTSPGNYELWQSPDSPQTSSTDQAWTAASIYYCANYLLKNVG